LIVCALAMLAHNRNAIVNAISRKDLTATPLGCFRECWKPSPSGEVKARHARESGFQGVRGNQWGKNWIPVFTGMTMVKRRLLHRISKTGHWKLFTFKNNFVVMNFLSSPVRNKGG
jgi:hypothetical protein